MNTTMEERIFKKVISNCRDCEHCETDIFIIPDGTIEKNPFMQISDYYKSCFFAYCEKECKFIIPITNYLMKYSSDPIPFPDFCPLEKEDGEMDLNKVCEWFIDTYPEVDDSIDGNLSDIIDIRNKMLDVLEDIERG